VPISLTEDNVMKKGSSIVIVLLFMLLGIVFWLVAMSKLFFVVVVQERLESFLCSTRIWDDGSRLTREWGA
jgi:biopolymer transport protein ExbB/TolQ